MPDQPDPTDEAPAKRAFIDRILFPSKKASARNDKAFEIFMGCMLACFFGGIVFIAVTANKANDDQGKEAIQWAVDAQRAALKDTGKLTLSETELRRRSPKLDKYLKFDPDLRALSVTDTPRRRGAVTIAVVQGGGITAGGRYGGGGSGVASYSAVMLPTARCATRPTRADRPLPTPCHDA